MSGDSSFGYRVLLRNGKGDGEADEEPQVFILNGSADTEDVESESEGERAGGRRRRPEDSESLIKDEPEIDEAGQARDYEVALKHAGFGLFHVLLMCVNGVALLSDVMELMSVAFVLPILQHDDEFATTDAENAVLSSVVFVGMLCGSYTWGGFSDVVGRRIVLITSLTVNGIFGAVSAFSPNIAMFIVCRFFSGIGVGGSLPVIFPYIAEFTVNKYRGPYMSVQSFFWTVGRMACGGVAWVILPLQISGFHSWRLYTLLASLPAIIGAFLYFLLPESPRYLLEHGKTEEAMRNLRLVHRINNLHRSKVNFPIKTVHVEAVHADDGVVAKGVVTGGIARRWARFRGHVKQLAGHTRELYSRAFLKRTVLMSTILFTLSFGSYGVMLWFPSYVQQITDSERDAEFTKFCHRATPDNLSLSGYCGCHGATFTGQHFTDENFTNFKLSDSNFYNVSFINVTFTDSVLERCTFTNCSLENVRFGEGSVLSHVRWNHTGFVGVNVSESRVCEGEVEGGGGGSGEGLVGALEGGNASCGGVEVECKTDEDQGKVYRDLFLVAFAATPGNIASAIAVHFMRRNYWMAISMFSSTASVFLLYVAQTEVFVVVVLCLFTALSTPAWNDSSLLNSDLYPTHLRSSSQGMHLLFARIGAILGTNIFGLFIRVNPAIPILLVASLLLVGSLASLPLPKTTRKTILK